MSRIEKKSWGLFPKATHQEIKKYSKNTFNNIKNKFLAYGNGRSYGDVCLNNNGNLILTEVLDNLIFFDKKNGILRAEAGVSFSELLEIIVPKGFFLPVTPGTRFITLGGAVANDIHGKNHHSAGTFGNFVKAIKLQKSSGEILECSYNENKELFCATIGGLGLTGLILEVEFELKKIKNHLIDVSYIPFNSLDEFLKVSREKAKIYEYTVAWLDVLSPGEKSGRGILICGNHSKENNSKVLFKRRNLPLFIPFYFPSWVLNSLSMRVFNELYFRIHERKKNVSISHYEPFFYPLDGVKDWNKIYGKNGFTQFQCVLPTDNNNSLLKELLRKISVKKMGSFLTVLKEFGSIESKGLLSFPREGITICLDFALKDKNVIEYVKELSEFVRENGGALYPAKDAVMTKKSFEQFYPKLNEFKQFKDSNFSSSFWERISE